MWWWFICWDEVSWTLTDTSGAVLASGGSPASGSVCLPSCTYGCTDPIALNYDATLALR